MNIFLYRPPLHGTYIDDAIFAAAFVLSVLLFIFLALADRRRERTDDHEKTPDD